MSFDEKKLLTSRSRWQSAPQPLNETVFKLASPVRLVEVSSSSGVPIDPTSIEFIISWNISGLRLRLDGNRRLHRFRCMTKQKRLPGQIFGVSSVVFQQWLNSDFIPKNGNIFEFPKNVNAIWFSIEYYPYGEILGHLRAVCRKISSKTCYRYRPACIWQNSFKIQDFSKLKVFADSSWNLAGRSFFSSHNSHPH